MLDARDPEGTRCLHIEKHLEKNCRLKHVIYVLNKIDLVPPAITAGWVKFLSRLHPTIAFKAGLARLFGKEALLGVLRQLDGFHKDRKNLAVGILGYPNVGKSSLINTLVKKDCCRTAPVPGETKTW